MRKATYAVYAKSLMVNELLLTPPCPSAIARAFHRGLAAGIRQAILAVCAYRGMSKQRSVAQDALFAPRSSEE